MVLSVLQKLQKLGAIYIGKTFESFKLNYFWKSGVISELSKLAAVWEAFESLFQSFEASFSKLQIHFQDKRPTLASRRNTPSILLQKFNLNNSNMLMRCNAVADKKVDNKISLKEEQKSNFSKQQTLNSLTKAWKCKFLLSLYASPQLPNQNLCIRWSSKNLNFNDRCIRFHSF